ncbi:jerky protein homolog-like [Anthonomus grandis grandis]|uniref:jerky protein homolog-like n=1 Tax=Anthonomus grandis grandis TaxID=2921223 RepID=UPI0021656F0D|nr:jerky protein homolog-like [Anthonomus grandis grandis]
MVNDIEREKLSSEPELVDPFKRTLRLKINELQLTKEQIYKADETGLYWKLLPGKTYVAREEKTAPGRKTEKQRVTFLACTNAAGTHKVKPLIIGKAKNPRSFRNFNCPVHYRNSKTAWMTAAIFKEWFHRMFIPEVTEFLQSQTLPVKAMLLLDNAASHPPAEQLSSDDGFIFTVYMPPNRKNLLSQIIGTNQDIGDALKHISLKDAILNLVLAWRNLRPEVIEKCWHNLLLPLADEVDDEEDNIPLSVLRSRIRNEDIDTVRSEIITLLQTFNPEVHIQPIDVDDWNKDNLPDTKETNDQSESDGNKYKKKW